MKPITKHRVAEYLANLGLHDVTFHSDHAEGYRYSRTDEGWSSAGATVYPLPDGSFRVERGSDGADCDGRSRDGETVIVRKLRKAERFYMSRRGRLSARRYRTVTVDSYQRDYSAEAAGY